MFKWLEMVEKFKVNKNWGATQRRDEILKIIESLGTTHISKTELAKKYGVSVEQIRKDFITLADKVTNIDKKKLAFNVNLIFEFAINELLKIARNEKLKPAERTRALQALLQAADKKLDNLIKLGLIKPVEEQINLTHSVNSELYETVVKVARNIRKRKGSGRNTVKKP